LNPSSLLLESDDEESFLAAAGEGFTCLLAGDLPAGVTADFFTAGASSSELLSESELLLGFLLFGSLADCGVLAGVV
jgi:hypothetical protein